MKRHVPAVTVPNILAPPIAGHAPRPARVQNRAAHSERDDINRAHILNAYWRVVWWAETTETKPALSRFRLRARDLGRQKGMHHEAIGSMRVQKIRRTDIFLTYKM